MTQLTTQLDSKPALAIISRILGGKIRGQMWKIVRGMGVNQPVAIELEDLAPPDSAIATKATKLVEAVTSSETYLHSLRSYKFSVAIGMHTGEKFDREVLYLGTLMHDLSLSKEYAGPDDFELESARGAHGFLMENGYDREKADIIHEAIALHTSAGEAAKKDPEVRLANSGIGLDVIGVQQYNVAQQTIEDIILAHNRENFPEGFINEVKADAAGKPGSHIGGFLKIGLEKGFRGNPLCKMYSDLAQSGGVAAEA
jgi:hypothetical protein